MAEIDFLADWLESRANDAYANGQTSRNFELNAATESLRAVQEELAALQSQYMSLQAEYQEYRNNHGPSSVSGVTKYGFNLSPGTSWTRGATETATQQVARTLATYGSFPVAKVFYVGPLPATFNANKEGLVPGKTVFVCFKTAQSSLSNGTYDATIRSYIDSIPAGWKVMLVNWQEPDDEIWVDKTMSAAEHKIATEHLCDVVRGHSAYGDGRAQVWDCWMEYSIVSGRWQDSVLTPKLDGVLWDIYFNTPRDSWPDPTARLTKMAAVTERVGIAHWAIGETGDNPHTNDPSGVGRAEFWKKVYTKVSELGGLYLIYFNSWGTTGDHRIIPGDAFSDPLVSVVKSFVSK